MKLVSEFFSPDEDLSALVYQADNVFAIECYRGNRCVQVKSYTGITLEEVEDLAEDFVTVN